MTRKLHPGLWLLGFLLLGALLAGFGAFVNAKPAPHVMHTAPQPKQNSGPTRYVYPFSVVDGGAQSEPEFQSALDRRDVGQHYADFARYAVKPVAAQEGKDYVSYRYHGSLYWTAHRLHITAGEPLWSDGRHLARQRCLNRLSDVPMSPTLHLPGIDQKAVEEFVAEDAVVRKYIESQKSK